MRNRTMGRRQRLTSGAADPRVILELATRLFGNGRTNEAFDLVEEVLGRNPELATPVLAMAWDMYQAMQDRSRYALYQSRIFDFGIQPGEQVLDMGSGHLPFPLATALADITLTEHGYGRGGTPFRHVDGKPVWECSVESTPFADQQFDFVYCSHVLEHVASPETACRELMRIGRRGYIETPSKGKDLFLNSALPSNHHWNVELIHGVLVFTEYDEQERSGLGSNVLMDMHCDPQTPREKAFAASIFLRAPWVNTMLLWEGEIPFEVRRAPRSSRVVGAFGPTAQLPRAETRAASPRVQGGEAPAVEQPVQRPLKLLQVHTFYETYLQQFYAQAPAMANLSFDAQCQALVDDGFSAIHILPPHLGELGYEARLIVANNPYAQGRWLQEHGLGIPENADWVRDVVRLQIEAYEPDVVYFSDPISFASGFVRSLGVKPRLVLGWRAANVPAETDWSEFDVLLSSLQAMRQEALRLGARNAEYYAPGFPTRFTRALAGVRPEVDVVFSGQYNLSQYPRRNSLLQALAQEAASAEPFSLALHLSGLVSATPQEMRPFLRPAVFGLAMQRALCSGRIAFDARGNIGIQRGPGAKTQDLARGESANMRIFEVTGSGVFLLTERFSNLSRYFEEGKEIETYSGRRELLEKVRYYLAHPNEREEIALRGQERCLRDHSMTRRAALFDGIVRRHLAQKLGQPVAERPAA